MIDNKYVVLGNSMSVPLPDGSVQCIVTSPPYLNLRVYDTGNDMELGREGAVGTYVKHFRKIARELWRVLRDDGTFFLVIDDSQNGSGGAGGDYNPGGLRFGQPKYPRHNDPSLKPKDMTLIPERIALTLQEDGWFVRNRIAWVKPTGMPHSAKDKFTHTYETVWLFTKSRYYYFDYYNVMEPTTDGKGMKFGRDVWTIRNPGHKRVEGKYHHTATYPDELVERCLRAGVSSAGACPACGAPYKRVIDHKVDEYHPDLAEERIEATGGAITGGTKKCTLQSKHEYEELGWVSSCEHHLPYSRPCLVLDPFVGSGTTCRVARRLGHRSVGLDDDWKSVTLAVSECHT